MDTDTLLGMKAPQGASAEGWIVNNSLGDDKRILLLCQTLRVHGRVSSLAPLLAFCFSLGRLALRGMLSLLWASLGSWRWSPS